MEIHGKNGRPNVPLTLISADWTLPKTLSDFATECVLKFSLGLFTQAGSKAAVAEVIANFRFGSADPIRLSQTQALPKAVHEGAPEIWYVQEGEEGQPGEGGGLTHRRPPTGWMFFPRNISIPPARR